ncbi:MAG: hypothetical protein WCL39_15450 [Armatimonadota bacterium]
MKHTIAATAALTMAVFLVQQQAHSESLVIPPIAAKQAGATSLFKQQIRIEGTTFWQDKWMPIDLKLASQNQCQYGQLAADGTMPIKIVPEKVAASIRIGRALMSPSPRIAPIVASMDSNGIFAVPTDGKKDILQSSFTTAVAWLYNLHPTGRVNLGDKSEMTQMLPMETGQLMRMSITLVASEIQETPNEKAIRFQVYGTGALVNQEARSTNQGYRSADSSLSGYLLVGLSSGEVVSEKLLHTMTSTKSDLGESMDNALQLSWECTRIKRGTPSATKPRPQAAPDSWTIINAASGLMGLRPSS